MRVSTVVVAGTRAGQRVLDREHAARLLRSLPLLPTGGIPSPTPPWYRLCPRLFLRDSPTVKFPRPPLLFLGQDTLLVAYVPDTAPCHPVSQLTPPRSETGVTPHPKHPTPSLKPKIRFLSSFGNLPELVALLVSPTKYKNLQTSPTGHPISNIPLSLPTSVSPRGTSLFHMGVGGK